MQPVMVDRTPPEKSSWIERLVFRFRTRLRRAGNDSLDEEETRRRIRELENEVRRLAFRVESLAPEDFPTWGETEDFARPHIEADANGFHFVVVERGQEIDRHTTRSRDEILYRIFESITFSEAVRHESAHRIEGEDFRRQLFRRQENQLGRVRNSWRDRKREEHRKILDVNPFADG